VLSDPRYVLPQDEQDDVPLSEVRNLTWPANSACSVAAMAAYSPASYRPGEQPV
jgi:hypothetical protein